MREAAKHFETDLIAKAEWSYTSPQGSSFPASKRATKMHLPRVAVSTPRGVGKALPARCSRTICEEGEGRRG